MEVNQIKFDIFKLKFDLYRNFADIPVIIDLLKFKGYDSFFWFS